MTGIRPPWVDPSAFVNDDFVYQPDIGKTVVDLLGVGFYSAVSGISEEDIRYMINRSQALYHESTKKYEVEYIANESETGAVKDNRQVVAKEDEVVKKDDVSSKCQDVAGEGMGREKRDGHPQTSIKQSTPTLDDEQGIDMMPPCVVHRLHREKALTRDRLHREKALTRDHVKKSTRREKKLSR